MLRVFMCEDFLKFKTKSYNEASDINMLCFLFKTITGVNYKKIEARDLTRYRINKYKLLLTRKISLEKLQKNKYTP